MRVTRPVPAARWVVRAASVILLLTAGCASIRRPDPPVDRSQDGRILSEVRARLESEPGVDASRVRVEVDGAIVLLYGSVEGIALWRCVIRNAELVDGVVTVVDYLVIDRGPREAVCLAARGTSWSTAGPQNASPRDPRARDDLPPQPPATRP